LEYNIHTKTNGVRLISWQIASFKTEGQESRSVLLSGQDITDQRFAAEKLKNYTAELERNVKSRTKELSHTVEELGKANRELAKRNAKIVEAQELLQKSQELYKIIARNFPKGTISVFDKDLNYVFVEGKELFELGVTSEMLIGTNLRNRLSQEVVDQTIKSLKEVFNGEVKKIDIQQKGNYYLLNAVPLRDVEGSIEQIMVVEQNITESKLAEDNIKNALKKERELGELKTRFVSMASHEFRTPLSTILTSASLLKKYQDLEQFDKAEKHIERIKSSVSNLTSILNDFLSLGKLEEGKVNLNLEDVEIEVFLNEISEEIQSQAKLGQEISYKHSGKSKHWNLDKAILRNICNNLLSNAVKYSKENSEIELLSIIKHDQLIIEVKDKGIGIPEDEQIHIFGRFFRAKNASNIQGTGLGLNIVKKYVELLQGEISFTSDEESGTSFKVIFDN
jgi:signal transduction histidine kinase